jgi:AAA ATPase domain
MAAPDFVGREVDLAFLRRQLDRGLAGEAVVSLVEGEAGMGKTRVAQELAGEATARGVRVVWVEADEAERQRSLGRGPAPLVPARRPAPACRRPSSGGAVSGRASGHL